MKATKEFSWQGKPYKAGDEVPVKSKDNIATLKKNGLITEGQGKSAEDVEKEREDQLAADLEEGAKLRDEAAEAERARLQSTDPFRPAKMKVVDQTQPATKPAEAEKKQMTETGKKLKSK